MHRAMVVLVVCAFVIVGGNAFAGGDGAGCGYKVHTSQAGADKAEVSQQPSVTVSEKADTDKVVVAQSDKTTKPVVETKK